MKMEMHYLKKQLRLGNFVIKLETTFKKQAALFQLFPYYWELLPVRLEKAIIRNNSEMKIHKPNDFKEHKNDF